MSQKEVFEDLGAGEDCHGSAVGEVRESCHILCIHLICNSATLIQVARQRVCQQPRLGFSVVCLGHSTSSIVRQTAAVNPTRTIHWSDWTRQSRQSVTSISFMRWPIRVLCTNTGPLPLFTALPRSHLASHFSTIVTCRRSLLYPCHFSLATYLH